MATETQSLRGCLEREGGILEPEEQAQRRPRDRASILRRSRPPSTNARFFARVQRLS